MPFVKVLIIIGVLCILGYPLFPLSKRVKKISTARALRYDYPNNRKNWFFMLVAIFEIAVLAVLAGVFGTIKGWLTAPAFLQKLFAKIPAVVTFDAFVVVSVIGVNLFAIYAYVILKAFCKKGFLDDFFGLATKKKRKKKKKKGKDDAEGDETVDPSLTEEKDDDVPPFDHSEEEDKKKPTESDDMLETLILAAEGDETVMVPVKNRFLALFFEGDKYQFAKPWVHRVATVLQLFIYLTEILYFGLFFCMMLAVFFPLSKGFYSFLNLLTDKIYIYPFVSLLFLQELCNTFKAPVKDGIAAEDVTKKKKSAEEKKKADLVALRRELLSSYGEEHCIRFFPATDLQEVNEYQITNKTYASAMKYISEEMKRVSGHVVQRYLEGIDALFNNSHISFSASFYSELGEYLIAYTYIRLLAGERQLFIVSDKSRVKPLKKYISQRLRKLTGCSDDATWRVLTVDDQRLVQADVLIACPEDFKTDDIIEHFPAFFEETCNAIFVDADRILTLDSYLCPIMAVRLQQATQGRIRFVFLSRNILHGFANSLRKFFCIDEVLDYSSLEENEKVSYYLWNRESKRIYQSREQRATALEGKIASLASAHSVDGVRVLTESPFDKVEKNELVVHDVEFNEFHKDVPDVNYLICTDERYNLASAIYAFTRFRGKEESILHIVSKPYLLREYFMAHIERYVNRSSFIQPRVTEHASERKISLLRIFCEASAGDGMKENTFRSHMHAILVGVATCASPSICPFCDKLQEEFNQNRELSTPQYAAYVIAALCDSEDTPERASVGNHVNDYYVFTNEDKREKSVRNPEARIRFGRISEVFEKVLLCNDRVELRLHDRTLGILDTFPTRVFQQYLPGQTMLYNNTVYEIESIAPDGRIIYLRQESITDVKHLDTVPLRRYLVTGCEKVGERPHRDTFTRGTVQAIELWRMRAYVEGETYAYHSLVTDRQALDFVAGMSGDKLISDEIVEKQKRRFKDSPLLSLSIKVNSEPNAEGPACNDGMRMLLAAVFNEFIRTIFPDAYRCIAVCPVLKEPICYQRGSDIVTYEDNVKTVYPYLKAESEFTTEDNEIRLLIINDCCEDVGVLDLLYNSAASLIQEFLTNIYGYLYWLKKNKTLAGGQKHYIYFGANELPSVYDLDGCCHILKGFNKLFSDGKVDSMTAIEEEEEEELYCAFCHEKLERGRYFRFDKARFICMDCLTKCLTSADTLDKLYESVKKYCDKTFEEEMPKDIKVELDKLYELLPEQVYNEYFYRIDRDNKKILVERDIPEINAAACLLRGLIKFWQIQNKYEIPYASAQLYYEELIYLLSQDKIVPKADGTPMTPEQIRAARLYLLLPKNEILSGASLIPISEDMFEPLPDIFGNMPEENNLKTVRWIIEHLDCDTLDMISMIVSYVLEAGYTEKRTSFTFLRSKAATALDDDVVPINPIDDEDGMTSDELYDPDTIPRFWKRYLVGEKASGTVDQLITDTVDTSDTDETSDTEITDVTDADDTTDTTDDTGDKKKKKDKTPKSPLHGKIKSGLELCPYDEREKTNPQLALYNTIVRQAADIKEDEIPVSGMSREEITRIFTMVLCDYPEFFWLRWYASWSIGGAIVKIKPTYRCTDPSGKIDYKQILEKRKALRKAAKEFTKGITRKTKPYDAVLKIYRRLILALDYDGIGLSAGIDNDTGRDDSLRSLYSALVNHKVVCAGYAVAMQYLLQTVGIPTAYVISENGQSCCHAFNLLKIGKECYYLDATWGDASNTKTGDKMKSMIFYDYFCVPLNEFKMTSSADDTLMHTPRKAYYPFLEDMRYTKLEYHRMHKCYFDRYDEEKIKEALVYAIKNYDKKEMGDFVFYFRCPDTATMKYLVDTMLRGSAFSRILTDVKGQLSSKEAKLLGTTYSWYTSAHAGTVQVVFK